MLMIFLLFECTRFGRRIGYGIAVVLAVTFMVVTVFSQSYIAFTILRFFVATASMSLFTVSFVIGELQLIIHLLNSKLLF